MSRHTAKVIYVISIVVAVIAVIICAFSQVRVGAYLCMLVWAVVFAFLTPYLRCPSCGNMPGRSWLFASYCPYCGEQLD